MKSKTTKKIITASLIAPMAVTAVPMNFTGQEAEAAEVIEINSAQELYTQLNNDLGGHYKLMSDIDLSGFDWQPVGTFTGTLEGNGHTIENLTIQSTASYVGLFSKTDGAKITDLTLVNPQIETTGNYVGGLIGDMRSSTINNVGVQGGSIKGKNSVGGLIGIHAYSDSMKLYSTADVEGTKYVGGLLGESVNGSIRDAYAVGDVTGKRSVGGFTGQTSNMDTDNIYAAGSVEGESEVGGLFGEILANIYGSTKITGAFALNPKVNGEINSTSKAIGTSAVDLSDSSIYVYDKIGGNSLIRYGNQLFDDNDFGNPTAFSGFNFTNTWEMDESGLPQLQIGNKPTLSKPSYEETKPTIIEHEGKLITPIRTAIDLQKAISTNGNYVLTDDLNLAGIEWQPTGTFEGTFDGNEHTVENLTIQSSANYVGLFSKTDGAEIKDLTLVNLQIETTGNYVGGLIGDMKNSKIQNVGVQGGSIKGGNSVGGLSGTHHSSNSTNVYSTADVEGTKYVGGLVGQSANANIKNAFATGDVTGNTIVGGFSGESSNTKANSIYATGNVEGSTNIGGLFGRILVNINGSTKLTGAFALNPQVNGQINTSSKAVGTSAVDLSDSSIYVYDKIGGDSLVRYGNQLFNDDDFGNQTSFSGFDFTSTWEMDESGLPLLQNGNQPVISKPVYEEITAPTIIEHEGKLTNPIRTTTDLQKAIPSNGNYVLTDDLNLSGINWQVAGIFEGIFDGDGHTIENLTIQSEQDNVGLFGETDGAEITNLVLVNPQIVTTGSNVGSLIGEMRSSKVQNVGVQGGSIKGEDNIGGLIGKYSSSSANNVYSTVDVEGTEYVGGLLGYSVNANIKDAFAVGDVTGSVSVGGFSGQSSNTKINNIYAAGNVEGSSNVGGLIGRILSNINGSTRLTGAFALNPQVNGESTTGKAIGKSAVNLSSSTIYVYDGMRSSGNENYITDTITREESMQHPTYESTGFDFGLQTGEPIWGIDEGNTLSYLVGVSESAVAYDPVTGEWTTFEPSLNDNQMPIVTNISNQTLLQGANKTFHLDSYFSDIDGDSITYTVTSSEPNKVSVVVNGEELIVTGQAEGGSLITVTADDGKGGTNQETFFVNVVKEEPKAEFTTATFQFAAYPNALEYIILRNGSEVTRIAEDDSAVYRYTDTNLEPGKTYSYAVQPVFNDQQTGEVIGLGDIVTLSLNLNVSIDRNDMEVSWTSLEGAEGYQIILKDEQQNVLLTKDVDSSQTSITETLELAGNYTVEVKPKWSGVYGEGQSESFTIAEDLNHAPEGTNLPNQTLTEDDGPLKVNVSSFFSDSDGDQLTYQVKADNDHAAVSNNGSEITITPKSVGQSVVTVTVSDGEFSIEKTFNVTVEKGEVVPEPPIEEEITDTIQNIEVSVDGTTATITWDNFEGAARYRVQASVKDENGEFRPYSYNRTATGTSYDFERLEEGKEYQFKIIPLVGNYVEDSAGLSGVVLIPVVEEEPSEEETTIPTVQNIVATVDGEEATISWDKLEGATRYRVQAYVKDPITGEYRTHGFARTTSGESIQINRLKEGQTYKFKVIPNVDFAYSDVSAGLSNEVTIATAEVLEESTIDSILSVTIDGTTAQLSWAAIEESARYRVQMYAKDESGIFVKYSYAKSINGTEATLTGLEEGVEYKFEVTPRIGWVYDTEYMISATAETEELEPEVEEPSEPVDNATVTVTLDGTTANVTWELIGDATNYRVQKYILNEETGEYTKESFAKSVKGTELDLTNLQKGAKYKFEVIPKIGFYDTSRAIISESVQVPTE